MTPQQERRAEEAAWETFKRAHAALALPSHETFIAGFRAGRVAERERK